MSWRESSAAPLTGRTVLLCLIAFFGVVAGANGIMMVAAITTFGGVETASSYQAGLRFSKEISAVAAQESLGWRVSVTATGGADPAIEIVARDQADAPLSGLAVTGRLSHPLDQRLDRTLALREVGPGVFRAAAANGHWDLVFELRQRGEPKFRSRNRMTIH
ncbi:MAG: FixH family protein [Hyphomicrobiales bacterium]|nr:FixH family protein [Hyphomicrobiales bacterium]